MTWPEWTEENNYQPVFLLDLFGLFLSYLAVVGKETEAVRK